MDRIRIDFTGAMGYSKFIEFDAPGSVDNTLEDIGRVTAMGSLYIVKDANGRIIAAIPGRRIEAVSVVQG